MYRRYSQSGGSMLSMDQRKRNRFRNIIIVFLLLVIVGLCVVALPALQSKNNNHELFVQRITSECEEAIRLTNTLSRNAGADSPALLARIRSHVYAMDVINVLSINQDGVSGTLLPPLTISAIQSTIDQYINILSTGMATGEQQTALLNSLEAVFAELNAR